MTHTTSSRTAIVVGASLAGLMTALRVAEAGVDVTVLERSADTGRTGAVIHVAPGLIDSLAGTRPAGPTPLTGVQTWKATHDRLRELAVNHPRITLHDGITVTAVDQNDNAASVTTTDGRVFTADLVIGADGHRSTVRGVVAPERPNAQFAGYVIWIGIAEETALNTSTPWPRGLAFLDEGPGPMLGVPVPPLEGAGRGARRLSWAWYDASRNRLLEETGSVVDGVVRHSILPADVPQETLTELSREARRSLPSPWREAVIDAAGRHAITGTPIAEYVPDRLVRGRIALVGDAAHVPTPMTGSGFSESEADADALSIALSREGEIVEALALYERTRLRRARDLVLSGQGFSRSFSNQMSTAA